MTREIPSLLTSKSPCSAIPSKVHIGHVQLRDLLLCPHERGMVCYPTPKSIVEHDLIVPRTHPRHIVDLGFTPNSLATLILPGTNETLLAAGGQEAELQISLYGPSTSTQRVDTGETSVRVPTQHFGRQRWKSDEHLEGASINNSVWLTSLSLTSSHESSAEPRVVVSNNDRTIKFFDIAVRNGGRRDGKPKRLSDAGKLRLDTPVNHSSISPDGRTLLSVGDSPDVYLHRLTGGARVTFAPMAKLSLSPYIMTNATFTNLYMMHGIHSTVPASFSTAFSADGSKFAVASQEGVVVVWDVRSTKPLKVVQTDKSRSSGGRSIGNGAASGYIADAPWDWGRAGAGKAPGWGVRSVKFSPPGAGREILAFTEHTSLLHIMDARTFETEEIVQVPSFEAHPHHRPSTARPRSTSPPIRHSQVDDLHFVPPRMEVFSRYLADSFRISTTTGGRRERRSGQRMNVDGTSEEDIVVIPPFGDPEVEDDVRRLLNARSSALLDSERAAHSDGHREDDMDVDELESDCLSAYAPSRPTSRPASRPASPTPPPPASQSPSLGSSLRRPPALTTRVNLLSRRESSSPYLSRRGSIHGFRRSQQAIVEDYSEVDTDQDLAGLCFDPSGEFLYVAGVRGVAEWKVNGGEQRWWIDPSWA